jgi:cell wall-associated NlpC family hydrolase
MAGGGIPGIAVGMATAGGVLVYSGLKDVTPLAALREIAAGRVTGVSRTPSPTAVALSQQSGGAGSSGPSVLTSGSSLVDAARKYVGGRYRFGGTDPATGLDCSAMVQRAFRDIGVTGCPRTSTQQSLWGALARVPGRSQVQPGDLVFWGVPGATSHVAIASSAGAVTIVEARNRRTGVVEGKTWGRPNFYRRYAGATSAAPGAGGGGSW